MEREQDLFQLAAESEGELVGHLQNLIRINTSNPPGYEAEAAQYIARVLEQEGIEYRLLERTPGRTNVVARLRGNGSKRPLLLMGHLDVVPAEEEHWDHPPFGAEVHQGMVWGRGALDCKNTVALWLMILVLLRRSAHPLQRDIILVATADEEAGHREGMEWLVQEHYEEIEAEAALNEGGGFGFTFLDQTFFTYQAAEKGNIWLRLTAHGTAGHGSVPLKDNPIPRLARLIARLSRQTYPLKVTSSVRKMVEVMAQRQGFPAALLLQRLLTPYLSDALLTLAISEEHLAASFRAMLHNTLSLTVLQAGGKVNTIPSQASCELDFRLLPGEDLSHCMDHLHSLIGAEADVEILDARPATESPSEHPLCQSIRQTLRRHQPHAATVPFLLPGVTDACFLRPKGMAVYGFTPLLPRDDMSLPHGHNERISLESLFFSLHVALEVVVDYCSGP